MTKPIKQYVPKPDLASRPQLSRLKKTRTLWSGPGLNYNNDGELPAGTVLTLYEMPIISDVERRSYKWAEVDTKRGGWLLYDDQAFEPVKNEPEKPAEPVPESPKPSDPPTTTATPRALNIRITCTATDEQWAQVSVIALQLLNLCTGLFALIKALLPQIVIEDMSPKEGQTT